MGWNKVYSAEDRTRKIKMKVKDWFPFVVIAAIAVIAVVGNKPPAAYHGPGINYQSQSMFYTAPGRSGSYSIRGYTAN